MAEPSQSNLFPVEYTFPYKLTLAGLATLVVVLAGVWWWLPGNDPSENRVRPPSNQRLPEQPATDERRSGRAKFQPEEKPASDRLVDLNTASREELLSVWGIGPATADNIMDWRAKKPFENVDQLLEERLVSPRYFDHIRESVTVHNE